MVDVFNSYARARFAMPEISHGGLPTGGLFGFVRTVDGVANSFSISPEHVHLCLEGGSHVRRHIFNDYKSGRRKDSLWLEGDMARLMEWCRHYGASWNLAPYREADDLIAHYAGRALDGATILSRDHDFHTLLDDDRPVFISDSPGKKFTRWDFVKKHGYEPRHHKLLGYLMGDPSDAVPQALPRCGPGTALKIARACDFDYATMLEHPKVKPHVDDVKRNKALIDWWEVGEVYSSQAPRDADSLTGWYLKHGMVSMARKVRS